MSERAWQSYWRRLAEGSAVIPELRVLICGPGRAGKTGLQRSLLDEDFQAACDSTVGMSINRAWCIARVSDKLWVWKRSTELGQQQYLLGHSLEQVSPTSSHDQSPVGEEVFGRNAGPVPEAETPSPMDVASQLAVHEATSFVSSFRQKPKLLADLSKEDMSFVTMWDFGGQEMFAMVQHLVMSYMRCAYNVVFDASLPLDAPAPNTFHADGEEHTILRGNTSKPTNFDIMDEWLDVLHHLVALAASNSSNVLIYLIGCQIDRIPGSPDERDTQLARIKADILKRIQGKPYEHDIADILFVDNTLSGKSWKRLLGTRPDPTITHLQNELINCMQAHSSFQSPVPLRWLPFTIAMRSLAVNRGTPVVSLATVKEVAQTVCKLQDENEAYDMLSFHHHLGHILYFPQVEKLEDSVVVDVSWLVKIVSLLFAPPSVKLNLKRHQKFRSAFRMLFEKGLLLDSLAWHIWQCYCPEHEQHLRTQEQRAYIFSLMEEYALVVSATDSQVLDVQRQPTDRVYWVPALAGLEMTEDAEDKALQSPSQTGKSQPSVRRSPSLFLHLVDQQQMPRGLFWRLVANCLQHFQAIAQEEGGQPQLYRSSAHLMCDTTSWLLLRRYQRGLQITVEREVQPGVFTAEHQALLAGTCQKVLAFVESSLRSLAGKIFSALDWRRSARCRCPYDDKPCHAHQRARCASVDCHHLVWLEKPRCTLSRSRKQDVSTAIFYWERPPKVRTKIKT